jgi:hypothetical protein
MNDNNSQYNRRDFLKGGSAATLMTMLGGVQIFAQTNQVPAELKPEGPKLKIAGDRTRRLGTRDPEYAGRCNLRRMWRMWSRSATPTAGSVKRAASVSPNATQTEDYKTILANKEIKAVVVATPTHLHKEIVLAALKADKHVYCEAPLANTVEDAKKLRWRRRRPRRLSSRQASKPVRTRSGISCCPSSGQGRWVNP